MKRILRLSKFHSVLNAVSQCDQTWWCLATMTGKASVPKPKNNDSVSGLETPTVCLWLSSKLAQESLSQQFDAWAKIYWPVTDTKISRRIWSELTQQTRTPSSASETSTHWLSTTKLPSPNSRRRNQGHLLRCAPTHRWPWLSSQNFLGSENSLLRQNRAKRLLY